VFVKAGMGQEEKPFAGWRLPAQYGDTDAGREQDYERAEEEAPRLGRHGRILPAGVREAIRVLGVLGVLEVLEVLRVIRVLEAPGMLSEP